MLKIKDETLLTIALIMMVIVVITGSICVVLSINNELEPSANIVVCKNVQKLYKDDILFDNFYISCNDETIEIGKELFTRIIENNDYKITYNKLGGIYLIEKVGDE